MSQRKVSALLSMITTSTGQPQLNSNMNWSALQSHYNEEKDKNESLFNLLTDALTAVRGLDEDEDVQITSEKQQKIEEILNGVDSKETLVVLLANCVSIQSHAISNKVSRVRESKWDEKGVEKCIEKYKNAIECIARATRCVAVITLLVDILCGMVPTVLVTANPDTIVKSIIESVLPNLQQMIVCDIRGRYADEAQQYTEIALPLAQQIFAGKVRLILGIFKVLIWMNARHWRVKFRAAHPRHVRVNDVQKAIRDGIMVLFRQERTGWNAMVANLGIDLMKSEVIWNEASKKNYRKKMDTLLEGGYKQVLKTEAALLSNGRENM